MTVDKKDDSSVFVVNKHDSSDAVAKEDDLQSLAVAVDKRDEVDSSEGVKVAKTVDLLLAVAAGIKEVAAEENIKAVAEDKQLICQWL